MTASSVVALTPSMEVAIGYDDNPAELADKDGSGVARYRVLLEQGIFKETPGPEADLFFEAGYGQYFNVEDDYQVRAGASLTVASKYERFKPGLFAEAAVHRDDLVAEDERDELILGGFMQCRVDARLSIFLRQTFSRTNYQNRVSLPGQRSYFVGKGKGPGDADRKPEDELTTFYRKDHTWSTEIAAAWYISSEFKADLSCRYLDVASTADFESYKELGGSTRLGWFWMKSTELFLSGFWYRLDYESAPQLLERKDEFYGFSIGGNRPVRKMRLFIQYDYTMNDSPVSGENYRKSVMQCGAVYSF